MGITNMFPSSALLGQNKDESITAFPIDELIEKVDGFAGVFPGFMAFLRRLKQVHYNSTFSYFLSCLPEHKYEIVKCLQARKHICGMNGDSVNVAPTLKKADIGIAVAEATDAARSAPDIVLTEHGLSVIISAVLTSRAIFQRMKNYTKNTNQAPSSSKCVASSASVLEPKGSELQGKHVKILNMDGEEVGTGVVMSVESEKMVMGRCLGDAYCEVSVYFVTKPDAPLFVKDVERVKMRDAVGSHIIWFKDYVQVDPHP